MCILVYPVHHYIYLMVTILCSPFTSPLHRTPVPRESHDRVTWQRIVFIPVVPGRPPNPEWPHHISHSRLGNGLRTWRYVWGTTLKHYGCLRIKAQRNSPVLKKSSVQYCPWQPHPSTTTCMDDNVWLLLQVMEVNVTLILHGLCWGFGK